MNGETWITKEIGIISEIINFTTLRVLNSEGKSIVLKNIHYKNIKNIGVKK
tara:strand:- start:323 stop:475 length:153 start_codon:yes stop_codon:yes gene_type:complete